MTVSWHFIVRMALQGGLVLTLAFIGGAPEQSCSPTPGISNCVCTTGDVSSGTDLLPDEARALSPELAANSVKTERKPVAPVNAAARVTSLGDGIQPNDRVPTRSTAATSSPFYLSHCAFLC
jgi:hypothetical protein